MNPLFTSSFGSIFSKTHSTSSKPIFFAKKPSVFSRVLMSIFAESISSWPSIWKISAHEIFSEFNRLKVLGINAFSIPAEVVDHKIFRDFSFKEFVRKSMTSVSNFIRNKLTISSPIKGCRPVPAMICFFNLTEESIQTFFHGRNIPCLGINCKGASW